MYNFENKSKNFNLARFERNCHMRNATRAVCSTRQSIISAFAELVQEKEYAAISITDIVKRANVSRMAYYRSFPLKEEIVVEYLDELLTEILERIKGESQIDRIVVYRLTFGTIAAHRKFFQNIAASGLTDLISRSIIRHSYDMVTDYYHWKKEDRFKAYSFYYHVGGLIVAACAWLENGMSESVDEMAQLVCGISADFS